MNRTIIDIDGDVLDLSPDTIVSQTLKRNNVGDLTTRSVSHTNSFKLPFTPTNDRVYQYARKIQSASLFPYRKQTAKIIQNGVETVSKGVHYIRQASNFYESYILSNAADFFDRLGNRMLTDLDFTGINGSWEDGDIENYRNSTSGVVAPVMDYGLYNTGTSTLNVGGYLPSIYYHSIIDKIFEGAGYEKSGEIFNNTKYLKTILAYSRPAFRYNAKFVNDRSASARVATPQNIPSPGGGVKVIFGETVIQDPKGFWDGSDDYTVVESDPNAANKVLFGIDMQIVLDLTVTGGTVDIVIEITGGFGSYYTLANIGTGVYTINTKDVLGGDVVPGDQGESISVRIVTNTSSPSVVVNGGSVVFSPSDLPLTGSGTFVYFNNLLPDISQVDFIKDFMITHALIPNEQGNYIHFKSLNEIIRNKTNAKDWTNKRAKVADRISFTPLNYAQVNYFKYSSRRDTFEYSGEEREIDAELGAGFFELSNDNIATEKTIYKSPFNNTLTELYGGIMMARIPLGITTARIFDEEPGLRKLLVRDKYSFEPNVVYQGPSFGDYLVAYFDSPDEVYTLNWNQYLDDHYSDWIASLYQAKVIDREYHLTEADIVGIDFLSPIFDTDSYFLVNEVKDFIPGKVTKVELLKTI